MTPETQMEQLVQEVRKATNKNVELFDRLQDLERRFDALLERFRSYEDRVISLERQRRRP